MTDRLTSDAADSHRATLVRSGGGVGVAVPDALTVAAGETIRLTIDGTDRHARIGSRADGPVIRGAYDTAADLRTLDGETTPVEPVAITDRLSGWIEGLDREVGDSVAIDVIDPGHHYGLRAPGERAVYALRRRVDSDLADIARDLDG